MSKALNLVGRLLVILILVALPVAAQESTELNISALVLDIIMVGGVILAFYIGSVFKGELKTAFTYVFIGFLIVAVDHIIETIMFYLGVGVEANEIIHRSLHLIGIAILIYGFYRVRKIAYGIS